jgi:hypothetical protein
MTNPDETATAKTTIHARVIGPDPVVTRPPSTAAPLWRHPAGKPLVQSAAIVTGLGLAPLLLDRFQYEEIQRAGRVARLAAPPVPAGTDPTIWPPLLATLAWLVAALVIVLALTGARVPKAVAPVLATVLAATTAFAVWTTIDVVNARDWMTLPVCVLSALAFVTAAQALSLWRRPANPYSSGGALKMTLLGWAAVLVVLVAGSAIAAEAPATTSAPLTTAASAPGLDALRSESAGGLDGLRGAWVPQVASAQVYDQAAADALVARHQLWGLRFPVVLARGGDFPSNTLGPEDWMTLINQPLRSEEEVQLWCMAQNLGPNDCVPRQIPS